MVERIYDTYMTIRIESDVLAQFKGIAKDKNVRHTTFARQILYQFLEDQGIEVAGNRGEEHEQRS